VDSGSPAATAPTTPGPISASGADLAKAALAAARKRAREAERNAAQQPISRRPRFGKAALGSGGRSAGRHSGSGPDDRDPQTLQATMGRLLAESGWEEPAAVGGIIHGWADLVGPRIAAHCEPVSFADGADRLHRLGDRAAQSLHPAAGPAQQCDPEPAGQSDDQQTRCSGPESAELAARPAGRARARPAGHVRLSSRSCQSPVIPGPTPCPVGGHLNGGGSAL